MADASTAFIHNAWYVIDEAAESGSKPLARTVLGHSIVLYRTKVAQLVTPETSHSTHYWTLLACNFARDDVRISQFMLQQQLAAFREDVFAIKQIGELQKLEAGQPFTEVSLPTDRAGVLMRRRLRHLAGLEQASSSSHDLPATRSATNRSRRETKSRSRR